MKMNFSTSQLLRLAGCILFDVAVIIAYFKFFSLFVILEPFNSIIMLFVLVTTLLIGNGVVLLSGVLYRKLGVAYATATVAVVIGYTVIANFISMITITGALLSYIVWQLIILACLLVFLSVISYFSKQVSIDEHNQELELDMKRTIAVQLMNIEAALQSMRAEEGVVGLIKVFEQLKERLEASTPFGRITDNHQALEIENAVRGNLDYIYMHIKRGMTDSVITDVNHLIEETRSLVKNREVLFIK